MIPFFRLTIQILNESELNCVFNYLDSMGFIWHSGGKLTDSAYHTRKDVIACLECGKGIYIDVTCRIVRYIEYGTTTTSSTVIRPKDLHRVFIEKMTDNR